MKPETPQGREEKQSILPMTKALSPMSWSTYAMLEEHSSSRIGRPHPGAGIPEQSHMCLFCRTSHICLLGSGHCATTDGHLLEGGWKVGWPSVDQNENQ